MTTIIRITRTERGEPESAPGLAGALGATTASEIVEEVELTSEAESLEVYASSLAEAFSVAFNEPATSAAPCEGGDAPTRGAMEDVEIAWSELQPRAAYYFTSGGERHLAVFDRDILEDRDSVYGEYEVSDIRLAAPAPARFAGVK